VARRHLAWLAGGAALAFLVPFLLADVLRLDRDLYHGIHAATAAALFGAWCRDTGQSVGATLRRRWGWAVGLGAVFAVLGWLIVRAAEPSSPRPGGAALVADLVWRGLVYGAADGLLLSGFPILVVYAAGRRTRLWDAVTGRVALGTLALLASLAFTATYHLGYEDFRSAKLGRPLAGDVVWSAPTLLTANPIGSVVAHCGVHVAAVWRSPESDLFLPPHGADAVLAPADRRA
jgi:hypothetical protein